MKKGEKNKLLQIFLGITCLTGLIIVWTLLKLGNPVEDRIFGRSVDVLNGSSLILIFLLVVCLILFFIFKLSKNNKLKLFTQLLLPILIGTYVAICVFTYFMQDVITNNLIFQPQHIGYDKLIKTVEEINLKMPDGTNLNGWFLNNHANGKSPLIIYFAGSSGGEFYEIINLAKTLEPWSFLLVNYRGYGHSEGKPNQEAVFNDALFIYDTFAERSDIDGSKIISMGYSLGASVAGYLSENRAVSATILCAPPAREKYHSPLNLALMPSSIIIKNHPMDLIDRAPRISSPLLCLISENDKVVSPEESFGIAKKWGGKSTVKINKGEGHKFIYNNKESWNDIKEFLEN